MKLQGYNFILYYILGKINTKADVLSRKDWVDIKNDNKDIQILKNEIWSRQQIMAEVTMIQRNQVIEETILLKEIQKNGTREQKVLKELEKKDSQSWEKIYTFQITEEYESKSYKKIII